MKTKWMKMTALACCSLLVACSGGRQIRTATDVTPGHVVETELDWRYGANDIRLHTTAIMRTLMNRWYAKVEAEERLEEKPRIIISEVDNQTDQYIPLEMVREVLEGVAVNDGRFVIVVGNEADEELLDNQTEKVTRHKKYRQSTRKPREGYATAPELVAKIRLTKATTMQPKYDLEEYRMTIVLYDIETQEIVDSAWESYRKKVKR